LLKIDFTLYLQGFAVILIIFKCKEIEKIPLKSLHFNDKTAHTQTA